MRKQNKLLLQAVTFSGADETVSQEELYQLCQEYPFVEFGILLSKNDGKPRYPGREWRDSLSLFDLRLSGHFCGAYTRNFLKKGELPDEVGPLLGKFQRIQVNQSGYEKVWNVDKMIDTIDKHLHNIQDRKGLLEAGKLSRRWIVQIGETIPPGLLPLSGALSEIQVLFDRSGGRGQLPEKWPDPICLKDIKNIEGFGYAGGLSPENIGEQLEKIARAASGEEIWIDMEGQLRDEDNKFSLEKCRQVIKEIILSDHISFGVQDGI